MLTIRDAQIRLLEDARRSEFVRRAANMLLESWPRFADRQDPEELHHLVGSLIDRARASGFTTEVHVLRFLNLVAAFDGDFPGSRPWAERLLADARRDPGSRLDLLVRRAYGELVERA